jgi:hypothetical protein
VAARGRETRLALCTRPKTSCIVLLGDYDRCAVPAVVSCAAERVNVAACVLVLGIQDAMRPATVAFEMEGSRLVTSLEFDLLR